MNLNPNVSNTFDEYQETSASFAVYPDKATGSTVELSYLALGLTGEAGEVAEKIKKYIRDGTFDREATAKELGDVLWYLTRLAVALKFDLQDIAVMNVEKLDDRAKRNKLQGSGDER